MKTIGTTHVHRGGRYLRGIPLQPRLWHVRRPATGHPCQAYARPAEPGRYGSVAYLGPRDDKRQYPSCSRPLKAVGQAVRPLSSLGSGHWDFRQ
jgi:hypothetical protein